MIVAEDDAEMRALLASGIRRIGVEVDLAQDGFELRERLLQLTSDELPEALVTDLRMPGWSGLSAIRWLSLHFPEIPAILITAFGDERTHARARELGAVIVFDKPLDLEALQREIIGLIDFHASLRDLYGKMSRS